MILIKPLLFAIMIVLAVYSFYVITAEFWAWTVGGG